MSTFHSKGVYGVSSLPRHSAKSFEERQGSPPSRKELAFCHRHKKNTQITIIQSRIRKVPRKGSHSFGGLGRPWGNTGSQVGGQCSGQWRCKETPGDEEEAELTWQLIKCGKPEQGQYRWCLIERETVTEPKGGMFWLYGQSPAEQGHTQSSCLCLCFSC